MNYQLAGMINSTNARVSAASSTGNMDFGNLQMQNHSLNNTSANKFDDNMLLRTGMNTAQQRMGQASRAYKRKMAAGCITRRKRNPNPYGKRKPRTCCKTASTINIRTQKPRRRRI
ncbi:hypothetical protein BCU25_022395 [Vibrio cyclitrophicus]